MRGADHDRCAVHRLHLVLYSTGIMGAAIIAAIRALESTRERVIMVLTLCPGVGVVAYAASVAAGVEPFRFRVMVMIVWLETMVAALAVALFVAASPCSIAELVRAGARAMFTHMLLWFF